MEIEPEKLKRIEKSLHPNVLLSSYVLRNEANLKKQSSGVWIESKMFIFRNSFSNRVRVGIF